MKIGVYGLVENIGDRSSVWMQHLQDADYVLLGDVGSVDNSCRDLEQYGANVYSITVNPWRYDVARNTLISLMPRDINIAIALDFNQTLPFNWKEIILKNWLPGTTKIKCKFKHINNNISFIEKIHSNNGHYWNRPVYECLNLTSPEQIVVCNDLIITEEFEYKWGNWHQLLQTAVDENPKDDELIFRLAHSWATIGHWQNSIDMHKRTLVDSNSSLYKSESMIHLSGLEHHKLPYWLTRAVVECPWRRETWFELACYYYRQHEWTLCLSHSIKALSLGCTKPISDLAEKQFQIQVNDMASMSAWNSNMMETSLKYAQVAASLDPNDGRLQNNLAVIKNIINSAKINGGLV